jgi:dTDP-glucose 4,6-dehydratase
MKAGSVLVTGGAGFLGTNFVKRSLAMRPDLEFIVLDKITYAGDSQRLPLEDNRVSFVEGDILDVCLVDKLVGKSEVVVHFAAETHNDRSLLSPKDFFHTNVLGTEVVAYSAAKLDKRFHHVSTDEVFGDLPLSSLAKFSEASVYRPSSPYSASKAASDLLVRSYVRSFGLRATITNCTNNYGPFQHREKFIPRSISLAVSGRDIELYGSGVNVRDWIHVDDHTDGIWKVIELGRLGETYILGGGNEISNLDLAKRILSALNTDQARVKFIPDRSGHDLRYSVDSSKAMRELKWSPERTVNFDENFRMIVLHYKELYEQESR